ncbi:hypothetical protein Q428_02020 [Fervidicella metallireducens AeB]|uniref:Uncharacterized protein n=1 Tax=Fervidicella metallireducens AeB TaxID=1403537 RepID=A0A017RY77_9CLOT|nr:hypothetical protein [Fervidicella metallireducens]EYE89602.1 hypothetical protein Q428_02020 [Fervidicella metallireducens AeB]
MVYWGVLSIIIILVVYYFANKTYAKKIALELMLYVEKKAEELSLKEGKEKFQWVLSQYDKLPSVVKTVVSKEAFEYLIQKLFDEALNRLSQ